MRVPSRAAVVLLAAAGVAAAAAATYWPAAALIARAAGSSGGLAVAARWSAVPVREEDVRPTIDGEPTRIRLFRPEGVPARAVLLVSGVHPDGIEDARLRHLAHELAATGAVVATPEIEDLVHYRITPKVTAAIEGVGRWMIAQPDLSPAQRLGVIGVSFSGGLAIVAAGRPAIRQQVSFVLSFGGHGDLPRVLRYLASSGEGSLAPHDYAVAVVLHQAADLAVPADQAPALRAGIETFLAASTVSRTDPARAEALYHAARRAQEELPEPSAALMRYVNDRDVDALGAALRPLIDQLGRDPALSPERSPAPAAPVYLLHGADDNVIPASEATSVAAYLAPHTRVRTLLSGFLTHVDVASRPRVRDVWQMVSFWKDVLEQE